MEGFGTASLLADPATEQHIIILQVRARVMDHDTAVGHLGHLQCSGSSSRHTWCVHGLVSVPWAGLGVI